MLLAIVLIILAIVLFGVGFIAKLAWWAFVIAAIIFVAGLIAGAFRRGKSRV
ncbi:hypothetical protein GIS00_16530 [Nakamurella sp. YIM 132087]|uniref:Hydrophobic protein n=1 Tax=Nakamurella alba TaxID=2665158 RepID=A0A7K1FMZ6_9ACTN|nr:hypothetical protein [Nakamurella alba]MTD15541.1 hypothetical protein [Nakamurella alba]